MAMVRWEELPQRRRDEIDNGCVALSGMTKEMWDDFFARSGIEPPDTLYDTESISERIHREIAEERRQWWAFWRR
jgi:hypothetical protein